jgi:hypothetical protein
MDFLHDARSADENLRMLRHVGAKFAGRAIHAWGREGAREKRFASASAIAAEVHKSDPDMSRLETRTWFVYVARRYIDLGVEAIRFGQVRLMAGALHVYRPPREGRAPRLLEPGRSLLISGTVIESSKRPTMVVGASSSGQSGLPVLGPAQRG